MAIIAKSILENIFQTLNINSQRKCKNFFKKELLVSNDILK